MRRRIIHTVTILLISLSAWGQTAIRGTTTIETDGMISDAVNNSPNRKFEKRVKIKPIDKSSSELEIRFYELTNLTNTKNLKIIKLKNRKWTSVEYVEWNSPVRIMKYKLVAVPDFESFIRKLFEQNLIWLPNQEQLGGKMKKFIERDGKKGESIILVSDGHSYTVEFKVGDSFRVFEFDNPDIYAEFYDNVEELKNYVAIKELFEKELIRE